jgi:hypothetical protein
MNNPKARVKAAAKRINFQVSGAVGGTKNVTLGTGLNMLRQRIPVRIPPGKRLVLRRIRYCFDDPGNRFLISVPGGKTFESASNCTEERPNFTVFSNKSVNARTVLIYFNILNVSSSDSTVFQFDGWSAKFVIK